MTNIFQLSDMYSGFSILFLDVLTLISFISGIFIIVTKNPIVSVLFLILLFSTISCYLIFVGIKFIGLSYLLVYVGAVSILFLFILMLINIRVSELISDTNNNIPLAVIAILAFVVPYSGLIPDTEINTGSTNFNFNVMVKSFTNTGQVSYVSSNSWDNNLVDITDIVSIGNVMYTSYSLWLIITSLILLLAMVGSIVITIKQRY